MSLDAEKLIEERERRRAGYLSHASDQELAALIGYVERGDDQAAVALTAKLVRRAELQGPPKSAVRRALARATRRRQRQQVARAEALGPPPSLDGPSLADDGDEDDLAQVIDLDSHRYPPAVAAWLDRGKRGAAVSPRAWTSQASRRDESSIEHHQF